VVFYGTPVSSTIKTDRHDIAEILLKVFDELKHALMNSDALAFPRYDLPFYLAVETSSKGIGLIRAIYERWNLILRFNINLLK
jgi:hypothetical protein